MLKVSFREYYDSKRKPITIEILQFGENKWEALQNNQIASSSSFFLGEWISEFLSAPIGNCMQFIETNDFDEKDKDDCIYSHRLFNGYLTNCFQSLPIFQKFMVQNRIVLPQMTYHLNTKGDVEETYHCKDITEFCAVLMHQTFKKNLLFKRCDSCDKWFVPYSRSSEKYCFRPSLKDNSKSCREEAYYINTLRRRKEDESTRLAKNIRQMYDNQGKDLTEFNRKNRIWIFKVRSGEAPREDHIIWLKSNYKKKYK